MYMYSAVLFNKPRFYAVVGSTVSFLEFCLRWTLLHSTVHWYWISMTGYRNSRSLHSICSIYTWKEIQYLLSQNWQACWCALGATPLSIFFLLADVSCLRLPPLGGEMSRRWLLTVHWVRVVHIRAFVAPVYVVFFNVHTFVYSFSLLMPVAWVHWVQILDINDWTVTACILFPFAAYTCTCERKYSIFSLFI